MSDSPFAVEMQEVTVRFPGVLANDRVNLTLKRGEIHALLGENGAGKSTLMNVLAGLYKQAAGNIWVNGELVEFNSPKDAIAKGIGMVHQHFMLVPTQTVTENILLGLDEPKFFMNLAHYDKKILALQDQFGLRVDPKAKIWQLSVGEQQRVEILKTLYRGANILIMDEPTAVLAPQEIDDLMQTMRSMVDQGKSIIFISHKLHEVTAVADRITVLRKGKVTAEGQSMAGMTRATRYGKVDDYFKVAEDELCLILQIESVAGLDALEEIASVDGVDGIFIGPADLSASMGQIGELEHPAVEAAMPTVMRKALRLGRSALDAG